MSATVGGVERTETSRKEPAIIPRSGSVNDSLAPHRSSESWVRLGFLEWHAAVHSGGQHGKKGLSPEFRQGVLDLLAAGRGVGDVARDLGISDQPESTEERRPVQVTSRA
jgi:hypothetical protein